MSFWTPVENPGTRTLRSRAFDVGCALFAAVASFGRDGPAAGRRADHPRADRDLTGCAPSSPIMATPSASYVTGLPSSSA